MNWRIWQRKPREPMPSPDDADWERKLINRMALEYLRDQRKSRFWANLFKLLILLYLIGILAAALSRDLWQEDPAAKEHSALVEIKGVISSETDASADRVITALREAFEAEHAKGIILRINSPGGSPVQSAYINAEIRRLKAKYKEDNDKDMPVYAVAVDLCASGGYYIAAGADEIYADEGSLVGSIGVRIDGFGFVEAMRELGVERRLLTAGDNKGILDPFSPLPEGQRAFIQAVLDDLHQQFIAAVKAGRGERLKGGDELFSGLFWSGRQARELGLVDGFGSASYVARELIEAETIVDYTKKRDFFEELAQRLGGGLAQGALDLLGLHAGAGLPR